MARGYGRILLWALGIAPCAGMAAGCGPIRWERTLEAGLKRAAAEQRPALIMFASAVSMDCREMDQKVFSDPQVQKTMETFVPVRLDFVWDRKLAEDLGVRSVPSFVVFRPDRSVAGFHEGKMDAAKFGTFLVKYRYY